VRVVRATVVDTDVATFTEVKMLTRVLDLVLISALDARCTVVDLMLRQLQAELIRLAEIEAGVRQAGAFAVEMARLGTLCD
jgi:hypothetical protein